VFGSGNSAFGAHALTQNLLGIYNTAIGEAALFSLTQGQRNIAIGRYAGFSQTSGSDNIYIDNNGIDGETGAIRIGRSGVHQRVQISGIPNTLSNGVPVLVDSVGVLGTVVSSARFKQEVQDMGEASELLMSLRPVTFRYREQPEQRQYGLVAEEVEQVAPGLVAHGSDGEPYSVRYHLLPAMLLNEMQKQQRTIEAQKRKDEELRDRDKVVEAQIATLLARLDALESQLAGESTGTDR
jgi:hypothetical protein